MSCYVLCSARNAAPFIAQCLMGVSAQTRRDWRMLMRDDGSTDDTAVHIAEFALRDSRIQLTHRGGPSVGAAEGFHSLLRQVPAGAPVALVDADDVWLPRHLERSLAAMREADPEGAQPILVHGDLEVVDAALQRVHPSLWRATGLLPEPSHLRRVAVDNVATGSTIVMSPALVALLRERPIVGAAFQDSWYALAAAAFGRLVARHDVTVRYRQHSANTIGAGARRDDGIAALLRGALRSARGRERFRRDLARSTTQAAAFAAAYTDLLSAEDRAFLTRYGKLPTRMWPVRALEVLRLRGYPGRGPLRALSEALRA